MLSFCHAEDGGVTAVFDHLSDAFPPPPPPPPVGIRSSPGGSEGPGVYRGLVLLRRRRRRNASTRAGLSHPERPQTKQQEHTTHIRLFSSPVCKSSLPKVKYIF